MPTRTVSGVHTAPPPHWVGDGFEVSSYFPSPGLPVGRVSPFLLMDYGPPRQFAALPTGKRGVGWHPHRGFETVTIAWEGRVAHRDNAGHSGVIGPGDVQWMTAGGGILHEEYHEQAFTRSGGRMHMMQLWVNLPRRDKRAAPTYQGITAAQIPTVRVPGASVRVIAGEFGGAEGAARTHSPVTLLDVSLEPGASLVVPTAEAHNAMAMVASGRVTSSGREAGAAQLLLFVNDGDHVELQALEASHVLFLAGEPLREPVVQYGPFVMNTADEIREAIADFNAGRFGGVPA